MGVSCRGYSVIVRNTVVDVGLVGGVDTYKRLCPNRTFCTDGFICRVGFMNLNDAKSFVSEVTNSALLERGSIGDFAIVDPELGILPRPDWLVFGKYQGVPTACLAGTEHVNLFIPESELDSKMEAISFKDLRESYDFVEAKDNVEHYVHKVTGRHMYIGRTGSSSNAARERTNTNLCDRSSEQGCFQQFWKRIASYLKWRKRP